MDLRQTSVNIVNNVKYKNICDYSCQEYSVGCMYLRVLHDKAGRWLVSAE